MKQVCFYAKVQKSTKDGIFFQIGIDAVRDLAKNKKCENDGIDGLPIIFDLIVERRNSNERVYTDGFIKRGPVFIGRPQGGGKVILSPPPDPNRKPGMRPAPSIYDGMNPYERFEISSQDLLAVRSYLS